MHFDDVTIESGNYFWIRKFVFAVIFMGLQTWKYVLTLFLVVFYIVKKNKSNIKDKLLVTTFCPSIVLYGITIRRSTSKYFPIKEYSLRLYDCVMECHDTQGGMS